MERIKRSVKVARTKVVNGKEMLFEKGLGFLADSKPKHQKTVLAFVPINSAFATFGQTPNMDLQIENEQEAAVAILFSCVLHKSQNLTQSQIEHLSRMLVLSSRFKSVELNQLTIKALSMQSVHGSKNVIEQSAPHITDEFKETLFAMTCEIITTDGKVDEKESEILAMAALYLNVSMEVMKMMLTTYLVRNRWNVQIIDVEE